MSRIHEALKKAEQERASGRSTDVAAPPPEITRMDETTESVPVDGAPRRVEGVPMNGAAGYLRFDDLRAHCTQTEWHIDPNVNVFSSSSPSPHGAEQFRTLRSRLYQLRSSQSLRTLVVTSSVPGEGKTFVVANLAQAIVRQPDRRALLVDADLRCARAHSVLGAPPAPGLTDYLRGEADEMDVIQYGQEGNLCFIPGGNEVTNPSELLSNGRLKTLLERVTPVFDWVILDSPPCLPVADATILADLCDGVLMVVRAGSTPCSTAQRACQEMHGRNVVGVVLNALKEGHLYGSYYYYQSYGQGYGKNDSKAVRT
ncbi:MAG TPA: CpsD/CapB family tyrosine-protein kinase [Candidatus Acidoferrales bacterium]|nr:CpsD/CapB family tyrosine-protein kinase [Candidatus Acidoferrales bacterium]